MLWILLTVVSFSLASSVSGQLVDTGLEHHRTDYDVGGSGSDGSYFPQAFHARPEPYHYVDLTYPDEAFHHRRPHYARPYHSEPFPWHWFLLAKAIFWKLKILAILKLAILIFLKVPVFLVVMAFKLAVLFKLVKLAKIALALPFLLPLGLLLLLPLIPLLLAPLLLLPLLLPLLLLLPIPVLQQQQAAANNNNNNQPAPGGRADSAMYNLANLRSLLESDQCIERIACRLAPSKKNSYSTFITWVLDKMGTLIRHPKYKSYVNAYKNIPSNHTCNQVYKCNSAYY